LTIYSSTPRLIIIPSGVRAVPASILLYGPPGCGKTKLAQAVAGEAQAAFLSIGPSDVLSKFVGESEASVKNLFEKAKSMAMRMESQCAVLFFDEIDALGMSRCGSGGKWGGGGSDDSSSGNSSRRILAELLIQLSKLSDETAGLKSRKDDGGRLEDNMMIQGSSEQRGVEDCVDVQDNQRKCQRSEKQMNSYSSHNYQGSPRPISPESIDDTNHPLPIRDCKGRPLLGRPSSHHSQPHAPEDTAEYDFPPRPRIIVVAATNRPEDCDPALLRRFSIRVLVGLPSQRDRKKILYRLLEGIENTLTPSQLKELAIVTEGWSGSDLESVTREAAMAPIRECLRAAAMLKMKVRNKRKYGQSQEQSCEFSGNMDANEMARDKLLHGFTKLRPVEMNDFEEAITFWVGDCADDQEEMMPTMYKKSAAAHYDSESTSSDVELDNDAQLDE
jgi:SpoVK/Ycf46/Vps4 family AAA+-type ATPase